MCTFNIRKDWMSNSLILLCFYPGNTSLQVAYKKKKWIFNTARYRRRTFSRLTLSIKKNWNICDWCDSTSKGTVYWIWKSPASMQQRWLAYNWKLDPANDARQWPEQRNLFRSTLGIPKLLSVFNDPMHSSCDWFFQTGLEGQIKWIEQMTLTYEPIYSYDLFPNV